MLHKLSERARSTSDLIKDLKAVQPSVKVANQYVQYITRQRLHAKTRPVCLEILNSELLNGFVNYYGDDRR